MKATFVILISALFVLLFLIFYISFKKWGKKGKPDLLLIRTREDMELIGRKVLKEGDKVKTAEKMLLLSDAGIEVSAYIIKRALTEKGGQFEENIRKVVREITGSIPSHLNIFNDRTCVFLIIGVNGVGKTLSCVKIAHFLSRNGYKPIIVAGDTFRAAAIEQLLILGKKAGVPVFHQKEGADPSAVVFDGISHARKAGFNPVIIDTAGRSHINRNLIEELKKIVRVVGKVNGREPDEILVVIDANLGQSSIRQILSFREVGNLTGVVLTKLDSTSKGGVVLHIIKEEKIPVKFVSFGEDIESIDYFDPEKFTERFCGVFSILKGGV